MNIIDISFKINNWQNINIPRSISSKADIPKVLFSAYDR